VAAPRDAACAAATGIAVFLRRRRGTRLAPLLQGIAVFLWRRRGTRLALLLQGIAVFL